MIPDNIIASLRAQFQRIHPLIFQRSVERAKSGGELFDILDTIPNGFPLVWCDERKRWAVTKDLFQSKNFGER
jgi:hypothetical protein